MKKGIGILFLVLCMNLVLGQSYSNRVVSQFDRGEIGIWVRQFEGLSNDLNPTALILGHTDKLYRGLFLEKGLPEYTLEGKVNGNKIHLLVLDKDEMVVGYIQGFVRDSILAAEWNNVEGGIVKSLNLNRVLRITHDVDCGKNKWIKTFEGPFLKDNAQVFLQKEEEGELFGFIHLEDKRISYSLKGLCLDLACNQSQLNISQHKGIYVENMIWEKIDSSFYRAILNDNSVYNFKLKKTYPMLCGSQIVQDIELSFVFPQLESKAFNIWLRSEINVWLKSFEHQHEETALTQQEYQFWVDIDFLGDEIISGILNATYIKDGLQRKGFVYDFKEEDPNAFESWAKDEEALSSFLQTAIEGEKSRDILKEDESAKEWYAKQKFDILTVRKEGLCFRSEFSRIFGERSMIVPWRLIEGYLKRSGKMIRKLN